MSSPYLTYRQQVAQGIIPKETRGTGKKPIAKRSEKMKDVVKLLKKAYARFLKTRPFCRIKSPLCTRIATVVHHLKGRAPSVILDEDFFCESCPACNGYVEEHPDWAMERGFKISRHAKNQ